MNRNDAHLSPFREKTRPTGIILACITLVLFSLAQLGKFVQVVLQWEFLSSLDLSLSPIVQGGEGLLWFLGGLSLAWGFWKGKAWSPLAMIIAGLLFALLFWLEMLFIVEPAVRQTRWPVSLALTTLGLGSLLGFLSLKSTRSYLGKNPAKIP